MDLAHHQRLSPELDPGERVLWSGAPRPGRLIWQSHRHELIFWTIWTGGIAGIFAAMFLADMVVLSGGPFVLILPAVFLIVGLSKLIGAVKRSLDAFKTVYAVTERRILILRGDHDVTSFSGSDLLQLTRRGKPDCGDLILRPGRWEQSGRASTWIPGIGLIGIENPRALERIIREALLANGETGKAHGLEG